MMSDATIIPSLMRVLVVAAAPALAAAALAACAQSNTQVGPDAAAQAAAAAAAGPVDAQVRARADCWMKLEGDKKAPRELDKRARLVESCVGEKLSAQAAPRAQ